MAINSNNNNNSAQEIAARLRSSGSGSTTSSSSSNTSYQSGSSAAGNAPVADLGSAGADLSGASQEIFNRAEYNAVSGNVEGIDPSLVGQYSQATKFAQAQKGLRALDFTRTIGSIRDRIAEETLTQQQDQAVGGFVGTGGEARSQAGLQQAATATFDAESAAAAQDIKSANAEISTNRQAQLTAMKPALEQAFGQQAAVDTLRGDSELVSLEKDQGFWEGIGAAFGGTDVEYIGSLDTEAFKTNANMVDAADALGLNIEDENFLEQVEASSSQAFTASSDHAWSKDIDFKLDLGEGSEKIGSQEFSTGQRVANIVGAVFNIVGVVAVAAATLFTLGLGTTAAAGAVAGAKVVGAGLLSKGLALTGATATSIGGIGLGATYGGVGASLIGGGATLGAGAGINAGVKAAGGHDIDSNINNVDQTAVANQSPTETQQTTDIAAENQAQAGANNNVSQEEQISNEIAEQARKIYTEEELASFTPENIAVSETMMNETLKVLENIREGNPVDPQILQNLDEQGVNIDKITEEDSQKIAIMNGLSMLANNRVNTDLMKSYAESNAAFPNQQPAQPQGV